MTWHGPYGTRNTQRTRYATDEEFTAACLRLLATDETMVVAAEHSLAVEHFRVTSDYRLAEIAPGVVTTLWQA